MANKRLTPFVRLDSQSEDKRSGYQIEAVDTLISQRKAHQKMMRRNKWLKRLGVLGLTLVLALVSYVYTKTPLSTLNRIEIQGNQVLSKQEILSALHVKVNDALYSVDLVDLKTRLSQIDLVRTGFVSLASGNALRIEVQEKRGVALLMLSTGVVLLTDQDELIEMNAQRLLLSLNLPLIVGMTDATEIADLARVLGTLNDEILVNISEIHKEKTAFSEPQMRLMMQDGNKVFAPLSALSALDKVLQVVKMTNVKNSCFYIADVSFSIVKTDCPVT